MWLQICRSSLANTCGMCEKVVGRNSIQCEGCNKWIHKKCSGVKGKLKKDLGYRCAKCVRGGCALGDEEGQKVVRRNRRWC